MPCEGCGQQHAGACRCCDIHSAVNAMEKLILLHILMCSRPSPPLTASCDSLHMQPGWCWWLPGAWRGGAMAQHAAPSPSVELRRGLGISSASLGSSVGKESDGERRWSLALHGLCFPLLPFHPIASMCVVFSSQVRGGLPAAAARQDPALQHPRAVSPGE